MIEQEFHFINDEDEKCIFYSKKYYDFVCALVLDYFNKELRQNDFHDWFINTLNSFDDDEDVYFIDSEMPFYWAMCIIENGRTNKSLEGDELEAYIEFAKNYRAERNIKTFLEEGV